MRVHTATRLDTNTHTHTPFCGPPRLPGRSVSTLQSNQLRDLVARSLAAYAAFFARHAPVADIDPQQDRLVWAEAPVFVLDLVEADGEAYAPYGGVGGGCIHFPKSHRG